MRRLLLSGVALVALSGPAFAQLAVDNVQTNTAPDVNTPLQTSGVELNGGTLVEGLLGITSQAVGNALSIDGGGPAQVTNVQVNAAVQSAISSVPGGVEGGGVTISTVAVGNNASLSAPAGVALTSTQINNGGQAAASGLGEDIISVTPQGVNGTLGLATVSGDVKVDTAAIGNNLTVTASTGAVDAQGGAITQTDGAAQLASTEIELFKNGFVTQSSIEASATSVSNNLAITAGSGNVAPATLTQISSATGNASVLVEGATVSGMAPTSVSGQAVGNNLAITAGSGNVAPATLTQINSGINNAGVLVAGVTVLGTAPTSISGQAVGNNLLINAGGDLQLPGGIANAQQNSGVFQTGGIVVENANFAGSLTGTALALGNNASLSAGGAAIIGGGSGPLAFIQSNAAGQSAGADLFDANGNVEVQGNLTLTTAAIGNNLAVTVGSDASRFDIAQSNVQQGNIGALGQLATTVLSTATILGAVTINNQALGNVASLKVAR